MKLIRDLFEIMGWMVISLIFAMLVMFASGLMRCI